MTVSELMEELKKHSPDSRVVMVTEAGYNKSDILSVYEDDNTVILIE